MRLAIGVFTLDTGRLPEETHGADRPRARALRPADRRRASRRGATRGVRRARTASTRSTTASSCARRAARSARPSRCAARWRARARGSPACAARSRSPAATSPFEEFDAAARPAEVQSARRLERGRRLGLPARATTCPYNALHDRGYPQHRLRALHARRRARRGRARRPLVVGEPRAQGMRPAPAAGRVRRDAAAAHELTTS